MRDREQLALIIFDQISQFTALLDSDGRVLEVNRAAIERGGHCGGCTSSASTAPKACESGVRRGITAATRD